MTAPVLVVGAGIGGIATAIWLRDLDIDFDWVEASATIGGTLLRVGNPIDELPGYPALDGPALVARYREQLEGFGRAPRFHQRVTRLSPTTAGAVEVVFEDGGDAVVYAAVILCTGTTPRLLSLPHEQELLGRGVELSVTRNRDRYAGQKVAVVGGGDAALEGVILLTEVCDEIHLIHRRSQFRGQRRFIEQVLEHPSVTLHLESEVDAILPADNQLGGVRLSNGITLAVRGLFVRLGVSPSYPEGLLDNAPNTCPRYLPDTAEGRGPLPGTYVVGDVGTSTHQSVAWAMGSAARAVATVCRDLGFHSPSMSPDD